MTSAVRTTLVFGAAGLIGRYLSADLRGRGFRVVGIARRFPGEHRPGDLEQPIMTMTVQDLAALLRATQADVVVNAASLCSP